MTHLLKNFIVFSRQYKNEERLGQTFLISIILRKNKAYYFKAA